MVSFLRNPRWAHRECGRSLRHLQQAPPRSHWVPSHAGNVQRNQGNHPGWEERQVNRKCGHFPPTVCDQSFVRQAPILLIAPRKNCYLSCGRISLLVQIYPILFWMEIREKKSFTVLGIFMTFKDYRKKNWFGIIYLLCYYLVVERILNIFLCLTMVILFVFFGVNFLTCLLTLLISEEKIPDPYLFLVPKDVLCHLSCRSLVVCED